jgi:hypothetical protein
MVGVLRDNDSELEKWKIKKRKRLGENDEKFVENGQEERNVGPSRLAIQTGTISHPHPSTQRNVWHSNPNFRLFRYINGIPQVSRYMIPFNGWPEKKKKNSNAISRFNGNSQSLYVIVSSTDGSVNKGQTCRAKWEITKVPAMAPN